MDPGVHFEWSVVCVLSRGVLFVPYVVQHIHRDSGEECVLLARFIAHFVWLLHGLELVAKS